MLKTDNFEVITSFRVFEDVLEEAKKNVREHPGQYENLSHYIRAAIVQLNNKHREMEL